MRSREISITSACTAACTLSPNPGGSPSAREIDVSVGCGEAETKKEQLADRTGQQGEPFAQQLRQSFRYLEGLPGLDIDPAPHQGSRQLQSEERTPARCLVDLHQRPVGQSRPEPGEKDPSEHLQAEGADRHTVDPLLRPAPVQTEGARDLRIRSGSQGNHHPDRDALQPPEREPEHPGRGRIQPLHVIHPDEQRSGSGQGKQAAVEPERDGPRLRDPLAVASQQGRFQRRPLRGR
jgi:hypothetical protein